MLQPSVKTKRKSMCKAVQLPCLNPRALPEVLKMSRLR